MTASDTAAGRPQAGLLGRLLKLAAPVAGTNALIMLMGLVDTIAVGRHSASELAELGR
jgi:multidrug resistance protein, MATE family